MKVGIDVSQLNVMSKGRGIGFYTDNLVESLRQYTDVEVSLIESGNVRPEVDLIHYPFFDFFKPTLKLRKNLPTVVTIHDVIPLLFPKHYPPGIKGHINLFRQKQALKKVKAIITDSETSRSDVKKIFQVNNKQLFTTYLAQGKDFKQVKDKRKIQKIIVKYHLPAKYLLYSGGVNWNKNLLNQTKAALEAGIDIAFVGKGFENRENLNHPEMKSYKEFLDNYSNHHQVHILGFVPTADLVLLENGAQAVMLVSFYEGFGLPILEAQACGTPIITGNISSMLEVAGIGAVVVDPKKSGLMVEEIKRIVYNDNYAASLISKGFENLKRFSWEKTAKETVKIYEYALSQS